MPADTTTDAALDGIIDLALDQMAAGDPQAAIPHLQQALDLAPHHPAATHALLRALEDSGQLQPALMLANACIAYDPDDVLAHTRLSILLQKLGDIPAAEAASARARILDWKLQLRSNIQSTDDQPNLT
jgi:tetratricopeptide (TPR) repeat protein